MQIDLTGRTRWSPAARAASARAIALRFARSGADVAILARDPATLDAAAGAIRAARRRPQVVAKVCDLDPAGGVPRPRRRA